MSANTGKKFFISHTTSDAKTAMKLCELLEARGVSCWIAPRNITPGADYAEQIISAIEGCDGIVVLLSKESNESNFVRTEVERAFSKKKMRLPIFLQEIQLNKTLEFMLAGVQWIRATDGVEKHADELASAILGQPRTSLVAADAPSTGILRYVAIAAVIAAICVVGYFVTHSNPSAAPLLRGDKAVAKNVAVKTTKLQYHALVIGINAYSPKNGDGWTPLRTARQDAEGVADLLEKSYGFSVTRLLDDQATAKGMMVALDKLSTLSDSDAVLIYFAGHGFFDATQNEGYWIPVDARKTCDSRNCKEDWLWNSILLRVVDSSPARHVLIVADTCFGGSLFRGETAQANQSDRLWYDQISMKPSRYLIASGDDQPVSDGDAKHSVFSQEFLRFLEFNEKPLVAASEIGPAIRKRVAGATGQLMREGPLNMASNAGGEFVFAKKGSTPPSVAPMVAANKPAGKPDDQQLRAALDLATRGATNTAKNLLGAIAGDANADSLTVAVSEYLAGSQRAQRSEMLRTLIKQISEGKATKTNQAGRVAEDFARPRIIACLGPQARAGGDASQALLYQICLRTELEKDGTARVIERERLEDILQELNLGTSDLADRRAQLKIGQLLPASLLLLGDLFPEGDGESVALRLVDSETSAITASFDMTRTGHVAIAAVSAPVIKDLEMAIRGVRPLKARVFETKGTNIVAGAGRFHGTKAGQEFDVVQRKSVEVGGQKDFRETIVGKARVSAAGDTTSDLTVSWNNSPPADAAQLWICDPVAPVR